MVAEGSHPFIAKPPDGHEVLDAVDFTHLRVGLQVRVEALEKL